MRIGFLALTFVLCTTALGAERKPATRPSKSGLAVSDADYHARLKALNKKATTQPVPEADRVEQRKSSAEYSGTKAAIEAESATRDILRAEAEIERLDRELEAARRLVATLEDGRADKRYKVARDNVMKITRSRSSAMTRRSVAVNRREKALAAMTRAGQEYVAASKGQDPGGDAASPGLSSGSGFVITKDGLILTNKHVVEHGKLFLVLINGKNQRPGEIVAMDDEQDLALIRVKPDGGEELSTVALSISDMPGEGAACTVMGYPLLLRFGAAIKVTRGVVSSTTTTFKDGYDVVIDAKVNPGNSGGPILDKHGNVMAIVTMKTVGSELEDTYGLGISAGRIRRFLDKQKVKTAHIEPSNRTFDTEEIAAKVKPATVCILTSR